MKSKKGVKFKSREIFRSAKTRQNLTFGERANQRAAVTCSAWLYLYIRSVSIIIYYLFTLCIDTYCRVLFSAKGWKTAEKKQTGRYRLDIRWSGMRDACLVYSAPSSQEKRVPCGKMRTEGATRAKLSRGMQRTGYSVASSFNVAVGVIYEARNSYIHAQCIRSTEYAV